MLKLVPSNGLKKQNKQIDMFDQLFEKFFSDVDEDFLAPLSNLDARLNSFQVDVVEQDGQYIITADLPGMDRDDVQIEYDDQYLTISAKKDEEKEEKGKHYVRRERSCGMFKRSFRVENIDPEQVEASFDKGVLTIRVAKAESTDRKRIIPIK